MLLKTTKRVPFIAFLVAVFLIISSIPPAEARRHQAEDSGVQWSLTTPPVSETHIFEGEINRRGKAVGFHSRPGGRDPVNARVCAVTDGPNRRGVYSAQVEIRKPGGPWLRKRSTFFPDDMNRAEVIQAILHAYHNRSREDGPKFSGPSGKGFTIEGYLLPDARINTAFPLYRRD